MLKFSEGKVVIGASIAFAFWLFVALPILYYPAPTQQGDHRPSAAQQHSNATTATPTESDASQRDEQANAEQHIAPHSLFDAVVEWAIKFFELKLTDVLIVIFTAVLAMKTAGLFRETAGLRSAADQQASDMKDSIKAATDTAKAAVASNQIAVTNSEQQLRAYVAVQEVSLISHRHPDRVGMYNNLIPGTIHTYRFAVILKNGGMTPAVNAKINISYDKFTSGSPPPDFSFPDSRVFGDALIGPQTIWHTPPVLIAAHELENPGLPATYYLWGWIEYDDIFSGNHAPQN